MLYLVIVFTVFGKRKGIREGLAITNAVNTVTSPLSITSTKGRTRDTLEWVSGLTSSYCSGRQSDHNLWHREDWGRAMFCLCRHLFLTIILNSKFWQKKLSVQQILWQRLGLSGPDIAQSWTGQVRGHVTEHTNWTVHHQKASESPSDARRRDEDNKLLRVGFLWWPAGNIAAAGLDQDPESHNEREETGGCDVSPGGRLPDLLLALLDGLPLPGEQSLLCPNMTCAGRRSAPSAAARRPSWWPSSSGWPWPAPPSTPSCTRASTLCSGLPSGWRSQTSSCCPGGICVGHRTVQTVDTVVHFCRHFTNKIPFTSIKGLFNDNNH